MRTPRILVTDGWLVDQSDSLTEVVIPSSVKTLQAPTKITFEGTTLNVIPSTAANLHEFVAPNILTCPTFNGYGQLAKVNIGVTSISFSASGAGQGTFRNCINLSDVTMDNVLTLSSSTSSSHERTTSGMFYGCSSLKTLSLPSLQQMSNDSRTSNTGMFYGSGLETFSASELITISNSSTNGTGSGVFASCSRLTSFIAPKLKNITGSCGSGNGAFVNCTLLSAINLPSIESISNYQFHGCTGLKDITLGSEGHPVSSLGQYTFQNCTQSDLTITVYTANGASLSGFPWGATNATMDWRAA